MNKAFVSVFLFASLVAGQSGREFVCQIKNDVSFGDSVEQSLFQLKQLPFTYFDDCEDALNRGFTMSGVYRIKPKASFRPFQVWCDMESEDGGWTIIQTRHDGSTDFNRTWKEYRNGFGGVDSEHWLGNNFIHQLTENNDYELKIDLVGYQMNEYAFAKYSPFSIRSEDEKYKLYVGRYTSEGRILDSLLHHNGSMFTTSDNDNDDHPDINCGVELQSGWWYRRCYQSNLNGIWMSQSESLGTKASYQTDRNILGVNFRNVFYVDFYSLKTVEMKVRKMRGRS